VSRLSSCGSSTTADVAGASTKLGGGKAVGQVAEAKGGFEMWMGGKRTRFVFRSSSCWKDRGSDSVPLETLQRNAASAQKAAERSGRRSLVATLARRQRHSQHICGYHHHPQHAIRSSTIKHNTQILKHCVLCVFESGAAVTSCCADGPALLWRHRALLHQRRERGLVSAGQSRQN
jgi:hypothetical protein